MPPVAPFIEYAPSRLSASYTSGSDTTEIDRFRQGVEIVTDRHRFLSWFTVGSGETDHRMVVLNHGREREYDDGTIYEDRDQYDALLFLCSSLDLPPIVGNANIREPSQFDGAIEPFSVRGPATFTSVDFPYEAHGVSAQLIDGNEDAFRRVDRKSGFVELVLAPVANPFFDAADSFGSASLQGFSSDVSRILTPFDELLRPRAGARTSANMGGEMENRLLTGTMGGVTDELVPPGFVSAQAGWTYDNASFGTDSVAFGGFVQSGSFN